MMRYTFLVHVQNEPSVLYRIVSLSRRRDFNIDSLIVARTERPDVSQLTFVVEQIYSSFG